jgi:hypothetical protein
LSTRIPDINYAMEVGDGSLKTTALRGVKDNPPTCMTSGLMIRELRQLAHRVSITAPSVEFLRDHFEGDHLDSFSDAPRRLLGRKPIVAGAHGGLTAQLAKFSASAFFSSASSAVLRYS